MEINDDVTKTRLEAEELRSSAHVRFLSKCMILEQTRVGSSTKISLTGINITVELAKLSFVAFLSVLYSSPHCDVFVVLLSSSFPEYIWHELKLLFIVLRFHSAYKVKLSRYYKQRSILIYPLLRKRLVTRVEVYKIRRAFSMKRL